MTTKGFLVLWGFILGFQNIVTLSNAQTTILSEGFEGTFPGSWSVGDSNPSGTTAYWADVYYTFGTPYPHTGNWSGYCAGVGYGGTISSPTYQNNMNAYMSQSIDLAGYSAATLSFWYVIPSIEVCLFPPCDYLHILIDGTEVFYRDTAQTSWNLVSLDLTAYVGGTHTLKFEFVSDGSFTHEGAYLDDILVSGQIKPDLQIPNYQFEAATVTEGNPFWVQASIYNAGSSMAGLSHVQLYLSTDNDFGLGDDYYVSPQMAFGPLAPGASQWVQWNFPMPDIGSGNYSVWPIFVLETDASNPLKGNVPWTASDPPPPQTSFGGTVLDSTTGNRIPGATVQWGALSRTTDGSGFYSFDLVPCGSAALTVTKYGYQTSSESYTPICFASQVKGVSLTPGLSGNAVGADTFAGQVSPVFIQRFPIPSRIDPTKPTWIVIHGRNTSSTSASIVRLAQAIASQRPNDQVLTLDWSAAAQDSDLTHEDWIQPVAQWAATGLLGYGFSGLSLNLVGHSWGGNMTDELAERISGGVNTIVALDPAENGLGLYNPEDPGQIDFAAHSQFSWAFHSSCDGSESTPNSADEAIFVNTGLNTIDGSAHNAVVSIFSFMLENMNGGVSHIFQLDRLTSHEAGPWIANAYSPYFDCESPTTSYEAFLTATSDGQSPYSIRYVDSATFQEITLLETADTISPTISAFSVSPNSVVVGDAFTISYTVSDTGGSGLNRVELWRANVDGSPTDPSWIMRQAASLSGNGPISNNFIDFPSVPATYWYGIHAVDGSGNLGNEREAGLGPLQGTAVPPTRIVGLSGDLAFGNVQVGSTAMRTLTIANSGNSALTVNGISYPAAFSGAFSGTIPEGNSQKVTVTFSPSLVTTYGGNITVNSDATSGTSSSAVTGSGTPPPPCDINAGLVAYYPLNGDALDQSGNGQNGTPGGDPQIVAGVIGSAFYFDGADDRIHLPGTFLGAGLPQGTVACWVRVDSFDQTYGRIIINRGIAAMHTRLLLGVAGDGRLVAYLDDTQAPVSLDHLQLGCFAHVAMTWNGNRLKYFIDATNTGDFVFTASVPSGGSETVDIGVDDQDVGFFHGIIDEVRLYGHALSDSEILCLATGKPSLCSPRMTLAGDFVFTLTGESNRNYRIEATTSLPATSWTALTTVFNITGPVQITNFNASSFSRRFYRAVLVP